MSRRTCNYVFRQGRREGERCNVRPRGGALYCSVHARYNNENNSDSDSDTDIFVPDNHNITPISEPQRPPPRPPQRPPQRPTSLQGLSIVCAHHDIAVQVETVMSQLMEEGAPIEELIRRINAIDGAYVNVSENGPYRHLSNARVAHPNNQRESSEESNDNVIELSVECNTFKLVDSDKECSICLEQIFNTKFPNEVNEDEPCGNIFVTHCGHAFHKHCFKEYIAHCDGPNPNCAVCRAPNVNRYLKHGITLPIIKPSDKPDKLTPDGFIELFKEQNISDRDYIINKLLG